MRKLWTKALPLIAILVATFVLVATPSQAGDIILSNNAGSDSDVFFIEGEPSMILNGFDLSPLGVSLPIALDAVSISVAQTVPGASIEVVIYEDGNGGSPIDANMVYRQTVAIEQVGSNRIVLAEPAIISEPVVWVGFYLPVGFRFNADNSGTSVLTYWAWTPGGTFDVTSLGSAQVLGPADGTQPVGIDMGGVARISAELRPALGQEAVANAPVGVQIVPAQSQDTSIMEPYPFCSTLLYDPEDIIISADFSFTTACGVETEWNAPTGIIQPPNTMLDLQRAGHLYEISADIPYDQLVEGAVGTFPVPVTHCMRIIPGDLERAVIAETRGIPERWYVLPTVRFNDLVCAEVTTAGHLSYFLPRTESSPPNVNLVVGWTDVTPHPLECGEPTYFTVPVTNVGQEWFRTVSGDIKIIIEDIHVSSGIVTAAVEQKIPTSQLGPGSRVWVEKGPFYVDTYVDELHRLQVRVDFDDLILETNEFDNVWYTDYFLKFPEGQNFCSRKPTPEPTPEN